MTTELLRSPVIKVDVNENKINYLWLNGERVIGIEGLQLFEDCRQLRRVPAIRDEQKEALNTILNATLEKYAEEGICNYWPSLIATAKNYFSEQGYCVIKQNQVTIDLREPAEVFVQSALQEITSQKKRIMTAADLWNIHHRRKTRLLRRYF